MKRIAAILISLMCAHFVHAQGNPELTELHAPVPKSVTPGSASNSPPSDAIVLFNGRSLSEWRSAEDPSQPAQWKLSNDTLLVNKTAGDITTKRTFLDYQLHIEWKIPTNISGSGQLRGNSGVFLATVGKGGYEMQIVDCYNNSTYVNGQAASVYKQSIPLVNACLKPGRWQTYDIVWTAPRFNGDGTLRSAARITAFHNGVLVQNNFELKGLTKYIGIPTYETAHGATPITLQAHLDKSEPISFRNIWIRPL